MKMMEVLQEPTFTAFLVLALFYLMTKIFTFVVSSSNPYRSSVVDYPLYEGGVAESTPSSKGLRVRKSDGTRETLFIGDDVINKVNFYQGSENSVLLKNDCDTSTDKFDGKSSKRLCEFGDNRFDTCSREVDEGVCQSGGYWNGPSAGQIAEEFGDIKFNEQLKDQITGNDCFDVGMDYEHNGSKKAEIVNEDEENKKDETDDGGEQEILVASCGENGGVAIGVDGAAKIEHDENKTINLNVLDSHRCEVVEVAEEGSGQRSDSETDDWEGIERNELEKVFAGAVNYVELGIKGKLSNDEKKEKLDRDVLMELYGLHKVAVEGPCHEPPPMVFKLSARAKWNAWHKLGRISREKAMEQYLGVLSERIPGWSHDYHADDDTPYSQFSETQVHEDKRMSIENHHVDSIPGQNSAGKGDPI